MKKVFAWIILIGILVSFLVSVGLVVAETVGEVALGGLSDFFEEIFSVDSPIGFASTTRVLLGVLLWMILYSIFKQGGIFKDNNAIWSGMAALIVTIITFMYLPSNILEAIAAPYAGAGATILTIIPFLIVIYFTLYVSDNDVLSRTIWIVFILYYFSILAYVLMKVETTATNTFSWEFVESLFTVNTAPYWIAIIVGIVIFTLFEKLKFRVQDMKIDSKGRIARKKFRQANTYTKEASEALDDIIKNPAVRG